MRRSWHLLFVSLFLGACASGGAGHGSSRGYAQSMDSATSACRQNPAYCTAVAGEEAVVPLASRTQAARAGASLAGALKLFEGEHQKSVEQASFEVNQRWFQGNPPRPSAPSRSRWTRRASPSHAR